MKNKHVKRISSCIILCSLTLILSTGTSYATTANYSLQNVIQTNGQQLTGSFRWDYTEGDFENGIGLFTELYIPGHGSDIDALDITIDSGSIEFSLDTSFHNRGVDVTLFLLDALNPNQISRLDTTRSKRFIEGGQAGGFLSGSIEPSAVPLPASAWLFISGLLAVFGYFRKK